MGMDDCGALPKPQLGQKLQREWRSDPVGFVKTEVGCDPWTKQVAILDAVSDHERVAVRSCNGSGKTFIAAHVVIWWLMCNDKATVVTTAPTDRQVRRLLWREISAIRQANLELIGGEISGASLELDPERVAFGFSTNRPERFQGFHRPNMLFVVDEASGVDEPIFDAMEGSLTSDTAKLLIIGNPTNLSGYFYDAFHKNRALWHTIHISAFETPNLLNGATHFVRDGLVTRKWVEDARTMWGEESPEYQIRVLGEFPDVENDTLIALRKIEASVNRQIVEEGDSDYKVMGLDVARFGNNRTVACIRKGDTVTELVTLPKADIMATTGYAIDVAQRHNVNAINVDEVGIGAGVLDRLRELGYSYATGVNVGNRASNSRRYANLRAELYDNLKARFHEDAISIPNDAELISELASITYSFTSRGQLVLDSKRTGNRSPDKADALMLAFAHNRPPRLFWA